MEMNSKLKNFAKDSAFYALGDWLNKLSSLLLVPILSRIFLPSDYGIIDLLNYSYLFLLLFIGLNIDSGMQKFYYLKEGMPRKILISSTMLFRFIVSCTGSVLVMIYSKPLSLLAFNKVEYSGLILLLALCIPMDDINGQLMLYLRLERKPISFSAYNTVSIVMQLITTYLFVVNYGFGIEGVFIGRLFTVTLVTLILMTGQRKNFTINIRFREALELVRFSLPGLPEVVQANVMNVLPRYVLSFFSTLTAVGLFGIADKIAKTVDMFRSSFNRAWNPFAFSNAGKSDEKYLYEKVFKVFAFCLLFLALVLTIFAKDILTSLTPPKYHSAATLVSGLTAYYALRALTLMFSTCLYSANKVAHTSLMATIQTIVFVVSAAILVPIYNTAGLVLSLDVSIIVYFICYALAVKRFFSFNFSGYRLLWASLLAAACCVGANYTPYAFGNIGTLSNLTIKCVFVFLFLLVSVYIVLTKEERNAFGGKFKSLYMFKTTNNSDV